MSKSTSGVSDKINDAQSTMEKDTDKKQQQTKLQEFLRPILLCMSAFGLYFPTPQQVNRPCKPLKLYALLVLLYMWIDVFRFFDEYDFQTATFGPELCRKILLHIWSLLAAVASLVLFRACADKDLLDALFRSWDQMYKQNDSAFLSTRFMRVGLVASLVIGWMTVIMSYGHAWLEIILKYQNRSDFNDTEQVAGYAWMFIHAALELYQLFAWVFSAICQSVVCLAFYAAFDSFQNDFSKEISDEGKFLGNFESYRRRHQEICRLLQLFDRIFSPHSAALLASSTSQIVLQLSVVIWHPGYDSLYMKLIMLHWMFSCILQLCGICGIGAFINHKAHSPLSRVHDLDMAKNRDIGLEIQTFVSRLTGDPIGLTALNIFVIDKQTLFTLLGILVTYFLVLVQFQSSSTSCCAAYCLITNATDAA